MSRLPIRLRMTAVFALALAVVLAGSGFVLYLRLSSHLAFALDSELQLRAQDLAALVSPRTRLLPAPAPAASSSPARATRN